MNFWKLIRPEYSEQQCEFLGMTFISPVGLYVKDKDSGIKYAELMLNAAYSYVIVNCKDLSQTIEVLRRLPREYNIIAHLDVKQSYLYGGSQKTMEAAFAILYDFVDAFLISSIDSLSDDVDSLLDLRLYNDEYRPILLDIPKHIIKADLDEILDYAMLNSVDGCIFNDMKMLEYANLRCNGNLTLIAGGVNSSDDMMQAQKKGADLFCTNSTRHSALKLIHLGRQLLRHLHKAASEQKNR